MTHASSLPHLVIERRGPVALLQLDRPEKRNAINDPLIQALFHWFSSPPEGVRVAVLHSAGPHFCAGLDLAEHRARSTHEVMLHSQLWHRTFHQIQFGGLPVVSAMRGAVMGGGLELATATHVRVAEPSCFYALPEGQRGIYVGGGASVRVARILGTGRMVEMMLTGRTYTADEGQAMGLSHHRVEAGHGLDKALELADAIASNAPLSNYAIINALPRIADMGMHEGLFTESLMAAVVQSDGQAHQRMLAFLEKRPPVSLPS